MKKWRICFQHLWYKEAFKPGIWIWRAWSLPFWNITGNKASEYLFLVFVVLFSGHFNKDPTPFPPEYLEYSVGKEAKFGGN